VYSKTITATIQGVLPPIPVMLTKGEHPNSCVAREALVGTADAGLRRLPSMSASRSGFAGGSFASLWMTRGAAPSTNAIFDM